MENLLLVFLCDADSRIFDDEYNLRVCFVVIYVDHHFATIIRVHYRVFYNINRHLLEPFRISVNASGQHPVLARLINILKKGVLLKMLLVF